MLEQILFNRLGKARWVTANGISYLMAPATSIVEGVLNGSQGALYYPSDEIARNYSDWDNTPLTKGHPYTPDGTPVSAKYPGVLDRQGLGFTKRSVYNGKLKHEVWFDAKRTKELDPTTYNKLISGEPVELSTGLFTDNEPAPPGSHHNGKSYDFIARNYRPDHIAILSDQVGACSINDGCGVLVNQLVENADGWATLPNGVHVQLKDGEVTKGPDIGNKQERFPSKHNPEITYGNKSDRDSDDRHFDSKIAKAQAEVNKYQKLHDAAKKDLEDHAKLVATQQQKVKDFMAEKEQEFASRRESIVAKGKEKMAEIAAKYDAKKAANEAQRKARLATANEANFRSEEQRKYLWSQEPDIAEAWAHGEHTSDSDHKMPEGPGETVKGHDAKAARSRKEKRTKKMTANEWQAYGTELGLVFNEDQPRHPANGTFQGKATTAVARSAKELFEGTPPASDGRPTIKVVREAKPIDTEDNDGDPEEDADSHSPDSLMEWQDSVIGNALGQAPEVATPSAVTPPASQASQGIQVTTPQPKAKKGNKPDKKVEAAAYGSVEAASRMQQGPTKNCDKVTGVSNMFPPSIDSGNTLHAASKQAAGTSLMTEHAPAIDHAMPAMGASKDGNSKKASSLHAKAASTHENQATQLRMKGQEGPAQDHDNAAALHRKAASMHAALVGNTSHEGVTMTREQKVATLTANCQCSDDRKAIQNMSNQTLDMLLTTNAKAEGSNADVSEGGEGEHGDQEDGEGEYPDGGSGAGADGKPGKGLKGGNVTDKGKMSQNSLTANQWFQTAPPEFQRILRNALEVEKDTRRALASQLVANISNKEKRNHDFKLLMTKDVEELRWLRSLMPQVRNSYTPQPQQEEAPLANYFAASGVAPVDNRSSEDDNDILELPTTNVADMESQASPLLLASLKKMG